MADGSVVIDVNANVAEAEKELAKLKREIAKTQESISKQEAKKAPLVQQAEELSAKIKEARAQVEMYGQQWRAGVLGADQQQSKAIETLNGLKSQYDDVVSKIDKIDEKLIPASTKLDNMKKKAGALASNLARTGAATKTMQAATAAAQKHMAMFTKRVAGLAKRVLVFSLVLQALHGILDFLKDAIKTSPDATAAIADLKGAMLTLAQPLVEVIIPAVTDFVNLLARAATVLARMVSVAFGKSAEQSRESAKALNEQMEALDGVNDATKKASKSVASFDEINTLSSGSGSGSDAALDIKPDFSGIQAAMSEAEIYMSGAMLALGAILAFTGASIPLGIGLMVVGAAGLAAPISENWSSMPENLKSAITNTLLVVGGGLLAIGAILAFATPFKGKGIALMVAGLASVGTAVALNWNSIVDALRGPIGLIVALVSGAVLAIGAIIAFSGPHNLPLGIGLMAAGAVGLASVVAINWNNIVDALQGPIGAVTAAVSIALLAIGAIIAFSGPHNLPLGIGLLVAGAAGLVATVAVNWDFITEKMQGSFGKIMAIVSAGLLVLGLLLLFVPGAQGLAFGLILAGAAGLATFVAFNWDFLIEKVREIWEKIKSFWNKNIAPIFTKEWWSNLAKKCGYGLRLGFVNAINGIIGFFEKMINWIVGGLNKISFDVPDWVPGIGGKTFGFNIKEVSFNRLPIPQLATGTVVPPNREFLAMLGDNKTETEVVSPLSTMKQAMIEALRESGGGGQTTIVFEGELSALARILRPYIENEGRRVGISLVTR